MEGRTACVLHCTCAGKTYVHRHGLPGGHWIHRPHERIAKSNFLPEGENDLQLRATLEEGKVGERTEEEQLLDKCF